MEPMAIVDLDDAMRIINAGMVKSREIDSSIDIAVAEAASAVLRTHSGTALKEPTDSSKGTP